MTWSARLLLALLLLQLSQLASAQLPPVVLTVSPSGEPKPALRYELLTAGRDMAPGNAAFHYLKAALDRPVTSDRVKATEEEKKVQQWEADDLDRLPVNEVREYLARYSVSFRELEYGTRCKTCEWAAAPAAGPAALESLLPQVQIHREMARLLALRVKLELAENRLDDAVHSLRVGIQFGKHVAEGPTLIRMLVGVAISNVFLAKLDELIARPGSPNLYWALSTLPRPFVDPRPGLDGEDAVTESFLPGLAELKKGPVSSERALTVVTAAIRVLTAVDREAGGLESIGARLGLAGYAAVAQGEAKKQLLARGWAKADVDAMPAVQAVFLNSFETYRELADDHRKWFFMPHVEAFDGLAAATARAKKVGQDNASDMLLRVFLLVLPAVEKTHQALARTDRKIALLRVVEAVRLHTAITGRPPNALTDVRKVPVPVDPLTGKPFEYTATDGGFTLTAPPAGTPPQKGLELRYEVKLRAEK